MLSLGVAALWLAAEAGRGSGQVRSAGFQHAVSQISNRPSAATHVQAQAGTIAIHQVGNLRYVDISVRHVLAGEPLQLGALRYDNGSRETFSVTRLSYLLSGFAFQREDGSWLELTNSVLWFDAEKARTEGRLEVPSGNFRGVRFYLGLPSDLNHADVAKFPPAHPLNPNLNGLHWNWQGGFIFMALEGLWRSNGALDGWSYHLARDTNRASISLAAALPLTNAARLELEFDLAQLFNVPRPLSFAGDGSSTHSRDGDPVAAALRENLPGAFHVRRLAPSEDELASKAPIKPLYLPVKFTPYRFAMSAAFPLPDLPRDNPLTEERVSLGQKLFHDPAISRNGMISCASCHQERAAFADPRRFSLGVSNRLGARQAMPLFNLAWKSSFFWDGRAPSLRVQALMPIQDHAEMDESLTNVIRKLEGGSCCSLKPAEATAGGHLPIAASAPQGASEGLTPYPALFARAFGSPEITAEKIGLALEQFVLTLTSFDSKFDRAARGESKLTEQEKHGFELFITEYDPRRQQFGADCFHCHGGPLFQSQTFANNGLDSIFRDPGRSKVTHQTFDEGKFATPSLRNVELTAPYMHDGRFATLEQVVEHYSTGVNRSATLDPNIAKHPTGGLHLSSEDKNALVAFLKTLTDQKFLTSSPPF